MCSFRTVNQFTLEKHERNHSTRYFCDVCGKHFHSNSYLVQHQNVHSGNRPYHCIHCDKRFTRSAYLRSHLKVHNKSGGAMKSKTCTVCFGRFTSESFEAHAAFCTEPPTLLPFGDYKPYNEKMLMVPTCDTFSS